MPKLQNHKIRIGDHTEICENCLLNSADLNGLKVLRICDSEYASKIQKTLLIETHNPQLNRQLCAKDLSFLLNVY